MTTVLNHHGVSVFCISKDTVAQAAAHKARDGLPFSLWCDPDLRVIGAMGLLHHKAIQFTTFTILGVPLGFPSGSKTMAIPTTLLIDEKGIVRWIDQADDYRLRGDEARIEAALGRAFGVPPAGDGA